MFKNKYLKQLQEVQAKINTCKARITELNPPEPCSESVSRSMRRWLDSLSYCLHPSVESLQQAALGDDQIDTFKYIRQLGEYFVHIADYCYVSKSYQNELMWLQRQERNIKEKLGID